MWGDDAQGQGGHILHAAGDDVALAVRDDAQAEQFVPQELVEGIAAGLDAAKPGNTTGDIARAFFGVLEKFGIHKDSRCGYPIGISYPPDWGERTMSLRLGDRTELRPGMTFHFMTGLWLEDMGLEITESILITETAMECLADVPRKLFVKD